MNREELTVTSTLPKPIILQRKYSAIWAWSPSVGFGSWADAQQFVLIKINPKWKSIQATFLVCDFCLHEENWSNLN